MNFIHPHFGMKINTESKNIKKLFKKLNELYSELPQTECIHCPGKEKVEAECCKVFSPPMNLIEFLNIMTVVEKLPEKKQNELAYACFESFLSIETNKKCVLLNNNLCSCYKQAPLSCRLFGVYSDEEYNKRSEKMKLDLLIEEEKIPFYHQCRNLKTIKGTSPVSQTKSDKIFKQIHNLDIDLFEVKSIGEKVVMDSMTYMPFPSHYLCIRIGPQNLETLTSMRLSLMEEKNKYEEDKTNATNALQFRKKEQNIKDFLDNIRKNILGE
jgi:Fe-S-cluster containining protein